MVVAFSVAPDAVEEAKRPSAIELEEVEAVVDRPHSELEGRSSARPARIRRMLKTTRRRKTAEASALLLGHSDFPE